MDNETTTILTGLSERGRAALIEFCRKHLRDGLNSTLFADALIAEGAYENGFAHFEIGGFHTQSGNPAIRPRSASMSRKIWRSPSLMSLASRYDRPRTKRTRGDGNEQIRRRDTASRSPFQFGPRAVSGNQRIAAPVDLAAAVRVVEVLVRK